MRERALILVVDDNEDNLELASQILEDDYDVITADSGEQCLEVAVESLPDMILLDVQMPGIDGYETLDRLLEIESVKSIPVVFLSARYRDVDRVIRGLESGALDYLTKPVDDDLLLAKVRVAVRVKRAEDAVLQKAKELADSNKTLESFAYSASHDLRAPLRHICSYCEALEEDFAAELPEDARFMLERISRSSEIMGDLIQDLLNFSRAARTDLTIEEVDITQLLHKLSDEMRQHEADHRVDIDIEEGMSLQGDGPLFHIVLTNLLSNAWKYSYKEKPAVISCSSSTQCKQTIFCIKDNGAGFDMAHVDKLFKPFSRLHTENEFEGNGIGLATVERIINKHGGKIWAEAAIDQGATFYFTVGENHG